MAPSPGGRGPAKGARSGERSARSLRAFAEEAERDRSDPEQLSHLLALAAVGDRGAIEKIFNENLGMVLRRARTAAQASGGAMTEDELVQEGSSALLAAIRDFAARSSAEAGAGGFVAFAESEVAGCMKSAVESQLAVEREQRQLVADAEAYERAEISVRRDKKREATNAELAEKLEWSAEKTRLVGEMVAEARRIHDEELLHYVEPDELFGLDDE